VESASLAKSVPLGLGDQERVTIIPDGHPPAELWANRVSPGYFETLGIPLLAGRDFSDLDRDESGRVAIVNEALAAQLWNSRAAVGSFFYLGDKRYRVIGVAKNTKIRSLTAESQAFLYLPLSQFYTPNVAIHVKSRQPPAWVHRLIERELEQIDPLLPVESGQTMAQQVETALFPQRIALVMIGIFCALGIYLTAIGLYGVIAHAARSRTKEIAIRMALGATPAEIRRLVSRQTAGLVGAGLCVGALLSAALSQFLKSVLVGADGVDLLSMAGTAALIAAVAIFATWIPTLRATRVEAAAALRAD
jgi:ABC-type antimicrobial peptide transport system permease subunit